MKYSRLMGATAFALAAGLAPGLAADLPRIVPVKAQAVAPVFDWTGFYLGAYAGVGANRSHSFEPNNNEVDHTGFGFAGGVTAGINWQIRNLVLGIEGDFGHLHAGRDTLQFGDDLRYNSKPSWIATARGRIGFTNGPTLNYFTAGGAWVKVDDSLTDTNSGLVTRASLDLSGYAIGSGVETMLGGNWTAKAEYLFVDVGRGVLVINGAFPVLTDEHRYHLMKFGLNYQFGGKPQPTLPAANWDGFYAGIVGGTGLMHARGIDPTNLSLGEIDNNGSSAFLGGLAGFNWQPARNWIAGVEGDISFFNVDRSVADLNNTAILGIETSWLATLRGRIGFGSGPAFFYITGGAAWVKARNDWAWEVPTSGTKTLLGFTVGGGIETVLTGNWTTRTEYLYVDAGKGDMLVSDISPIQIDHRFHLFRTALTYRFASGAAAN